jgi:hypothetical protein
VDLKSFKPSKSKIGEYGIRYKPVEGYKRKDGVKVPPTWKKEVFYWKRHT